MYESENLSFFYRLISGYQSWPSSLVQSARSDQVRHAGNSNRVNTNLTMLNLDVAVFTPVCSPLVLHLPVEALVLVIAPTDELHGVPSNVLSCRVLVDATFVVHEVLKDLQAHKEGSILVKLLLDFLLRDSDSDGARFAVVLVVGCLAAI